MVRRWLNLTRYHPVALFLVMGAFGALFAWNTINLAQLGMANIGLIRRFGWQALVDGGLLQFIQIVAQGYMSLLFYLAFKACETELMRRWRQRIRPDDPLAAISPPVKPAPSPPAPPNS